MISSFHVVQQILSSLGQSVLDLPDDEPPDGQVDPKSNASVKKDLGDVSVQEHADLEDSHVKELLPVKRVAIVLGLINDGWLGPWLVPCTWRLQWRSWRLLLSDSRLLLSD